MMTSAPNRRYSGHHKAIEEEDNQGILGEEIWRKKCGQQDTSTAGGRWRRQHKIELDGNMWSVDCVPPGVTWHRSSISIRHKYESQVRTTADFKLKSSFSNLLCLENTSNSGHNFYNKSL